MPNPATIDDRVRKLIGVHLGVTDFAWEAKLVDHLGADSLDIVELPIVFEEEFGIEVDFETALAWETAGDLLASVKGAG